MCFREEKFVDLEKKFSPDLLNTTMYLISMSLQVSTVAVNYKVTMYLISMSLQVSTVAVNYTVIYAVTGNWHILVSTVCVIRFILLTGTAIHAKLERKQASVL